MAFYLGDSPDVKVIFLTMELTCASINKVADICQTALVVDTGNLNDLRFIIFMFEFVYNQPGSNTRNELLHNVNLMGAHGSDFTLNRL